MKFENVQTMNFKGALTGMRNPMNSWNKSDSYFGFICLDDTEVIYQIIEKWMNKKYPNIDLHYKYDNEKINKEIDNIDAWLVKNGTLKTDNCRYPSFVEVAYIGPNDMELAQRLIKAGGEHRKFLRQIFITVDITAPLYWWKEFDTYKIGTTANSTSTMHKLSSTPITLDCFEIDDYIETRLGNINANTIIQYCEDLRLKYLETKDIRYWKELIRWLPESWLQTRTITMNYENIFNICRQRKGHKLTEWKQFIDWVKTLPYNQEFIFINELEK